jgi:hypothetical protein
MTPGEAKGLSVLAQLRGGTKNHPVKWAGTVLPLVMRVLSSSEVLECHAAALAKFNELKLPADMFFSSLFEEELATQILFRACRSADDPSQPFAASASDIRDNTTPAERNEMTQLYADISTANDPTPERLGEDLCALVDAAVKKKDRAQLRRFGSSVLAVYMTTGDERPSN